MSTIVTFYSFKGGMGRTMALANIAVLLVRRGLRVLAADWDLEAPGLDRYFRAYGIHSSNEAGLLDMLVDAAKATDLSQKPDWRGYLSQVNFDGKYPLSLIRRS
jgi:MinD-like ATPase involved in chromosome partitioning or flagellar assembly